MRFLLFIFAVFHFKLSALTPPLLLDFDSLVLGSRTWEKTGPLFDDFYFYKALFEKNGLLFIDPPHQQCKIPKVLHFIWVGPNPYPEKSVQKMLSWKKHHQDWTIKFWTDSIHQPCPIEGIEKHLVSEFEWDYFGKFYNRTSNYGEKSDLLRYEILWREGGLYIDHDIFCFRSFEDFHRTYDFFCFLDAPHINPGIWLLFFPNNGLIGSIPRHPILIETIENVLKRWDQAEKTFPGHDRIAEGSRVFYRTFHSFILGVRKWIDHPDYINTIFPPACCYSRILLRYEPSIQFCEHSFDCSWLKDNPLPTRKNKEKH